MQKNLCAQLKALREAAGFTQAELATIAGLSVHGVSALERGQRRRPHVDTVRALSAALDLNGATRDALIASARAPAHNAAVDELSDVSLPLALTILLGCDADVQTLRLWLADPTARLITLTGPGGVGKTRLALELARAIAAEGSTRVVFVPLAAIRNPSFVASAIAEALGLSDVTALDLSRRARVACADQPTLLVLDNFEQGSDAAPLVADLLTSVVPLRLLVTSRAPLHVRGEREYAVGPLALEVGSDAVSPADLARSPAVRLFVERVRDVRPDFRLTPANGPTVTAIYRRLDSGESSAVPDARNRACVGAAVMWHTHGEPGRARAGLTRALALADGADAMPLVAHAEMLFGHVEHAAGNLTAARARFACGIERFQTLAIPWGTGNALIGMAVTALATGDVAHGTPAG
jgi:transcriptional regulator with XRE-family HTH domain